MTMVKNILNIATINFFILVLLAISTNANTTIVDKNIIQLYSMIHWYDGEPVILNQPDKYAIGDLERIAFENGSHHQQQLRFPNVEDVCFEHLESWDGSPITSNNGEIKNFMVRPWFWILVVHYPQKTGNMMVDQAIAKFAKERFISYLPIDPESIQDININEWYNTLPKIYYPVDYDLIKAFVVNRSDMTHKDDFGSVLQDIFQRFFAVTYAITRHDEKIFTVLFNESVNLGRASGPGQQIYILNYNMYTGMPITVSDIIPMPEQNLAPILDYLNELALQKYAYNDDRDIEETKNELADKIDSDFKDLHTMDIDKVLDMLNMAIVPEGLYVAFQNCVIRSCMNGPSFILIPKAELAELGINTQYWEDK